MLWCYNSYTYTVPPNECGTSHGRSQEYLKSLLWSRYPSADVGQMSDLTLASKRPTPSTSLWEGPHTPTALVSEHGLQSDVQFLKLKQLNLMMPELSFSLHRGFVAAKQRPRCSHHPPLLSTLVTESQAEQPSAAG